jgi:hypothetical protein
MTILLATKSTLAMGQPIRSLAPARLRAQCPLLLPHTTNRPRRRAKACPPNPSRGVSDLSTIMTERRLRTLGRGTCSMSVSESSSPMPVARALFAEMKIEGRSCKRALEESNRNRNPRGLYRTALLKMRVAVEGGWTVSSCRRTFNNHLYGHRMAAKLSLVPPLPPANVTDVGQAPEFPQQLANSLCRRPKLSPNHPSLSRPATCRRMPLYLPLGHKALSCPHFNLCQSHRRPSLRASLLHRLLRRLSYRRQVSLSQRNLPHPLLSPLSRSPIWSSFNTRRCSQLPSELVGDGSRRKKHAKPSAKGP